LEKIDFPICPVCGKNAIGGFTHTGCHRQYSLDGLFAGIRYQGIGKKLIHSLKYKSVYDISKTIVQLFWENVGNELPFVDFIVPVPLHRKRQLERGFNQSLYLGKILSRKINIPLRNILERSVNTIPQVSFKRDKRLKNVRNSFKLRDKAYIKGKIIGLVDDVSTTQATLSECGNVLKRNGALKVYGMVMAHG
jgi:ComF family protein